MKKQNIRNVLVLAILMGFGPYQAAPAYAQTILIDFGSASSWRGVTTPAPDANGNYWNSVWSGAYFPNLIDISGNPTAVDFGFAYAEGTDSYNGPAGVTANPVTQAMIDATDIDTSALGSLGTKEACFDYYVSSRFEIQGLDPAKTYNLTFFGSHKYSSDAATVYSVCTNSTYSTVVAEVSLNVSDAPNSPTHNRDRTVTITGISPQTNNSLYIKFIGANGNLGYLNCMRIEDTLGLIVTSPQPGDGVTDAAISSNLKWNKPADYTPVKYVLCFRPNNSNWLDTANTTTVDPVVDLNLDGDPATTHAAVPVTLNYETTYYWKVSAFEPSNPSPIEHEGPTWSFSTQAGPPGPKKLMAHYMPWYKSQPYSGSWGWHWTMNHFSPPTTIASHYYPLFGPYDSTDPHVLASQALLLKFAGIDGMIADWYGIEDFYDYAFVRDATNAFIPYVKQAGLEFSICYEDQTVGHMLNGGHFANRTEAVAHGVEVMEWLEDNYFTDASYLKINDRPVLLCFGPQFFTYAEWLTLFEGLNPQPHFFPLKYHDAPKTGEFDWPAPGDGTEGIIPNLNDFYSRSASSGWAHFIGAAFPRFHDIYQEAGVGSSYGYIDDQNTATFALTLENGILSDADIVQLVTWNDYGEGTIIEPTQEDGYAYLEIIQQARKNHIAPDFPYTAADLRLPIRLYNMRKTYQGNPVKMAQLDTVEDYLFADQLIQARLLMNQIDCGTAIQADFNGDCRVDFADFQMLSNVWLTNSSDFNWDRYIDISDPKDNIIDILDLRKFAENWLIINL